MTPRRPKKNAYLKDRQSDRDDYRTWQAALSAGSKRARAIMSRRPAIFTAPIVPSGLLVAEGDSWFDYPFFDVLTELEDKFGYVVESVAHKGDTIEEMVYASVQLSQLDRKLQQFKNEKREPKAILLSGGGNDIAGPQFAVLLNHKLSGESSLNERVVGGVVDDRLLFAIVCLSKAITDLCNNAFKKAIPILIHGYDYPVADGRGYLGGSWPLPGPWLEPGFRQKGYSDMSERVAIMVKLIDRFNGVIHQAAGGTGLEHLKHIDLRGTLSNVLPTEYKKWWDNELHPTEVGFAKVAQRFHRELLKL